MTIKTHLPWPLRVVFLGLVMGLGLAVAMWTYELGRNLTGLGKNVNYQQFVSMQTELEKMNAERDKLSALADAAESQLTIERSAQKQLAAQVLGLEAENIKLKEDLAFFEKLLPVQANVSGLTIRQLNAEIIGVNQLKYRLLVMQGGKAANDFVGNLQLVVTVVNGGKSAMMTFPDGNINDTGRDKFKLKFRHYQRVEGMLTLPPGASIKAVQVRVLEKGQVRAQQSVNL